MTQFPFLTREEDFSQPGVLTISGATLADGFGTQVSVIGDVNADGIEDLLISAPFGDSVTFDVGATYILFGRAVGFSSNIDISDLQPGDAIRIYGADIDSMAGQLSTAGDYNGDGRPDLLIGAFGSRDDAAYLLLQPEGGFGAEINLLSAPPDQVIRIDVPSLSAMTTADLNGDGIDDLVLGDYLHSVTVDGRSGQVGRVAVVFGSEAGFAGPVDINLLDGENGFVFRGPVVEARTAGQLVTQRVGQLVSSAGDFNGDGIEDLLIGQSSVADNSKVWILYGRHTGFSALIAPDDLRDAGGRAVHGLEFYDPDRSIGLFDIRSLGDIDNDGLNDIGIFREGNAGIRAIHLVLGTQQNNLLFRQDIGAFAAKWRGFDLLETVTLNGGLVSNFASGDINGDGHDDIALSYGSERNSNSGFVRVLYGGPDGFMGRGQTFHLDDLDSRTGFTVDGALGTYLGSSISFGDLNADGLDDLVIGAPETVSKASASDPGKVHILWGRQSETSVVIDGTVNARAYTGGMADDRIFGRDGDDTLRGHAGDDWLNGEGDNDLLIGGEGHDTLLGGSGADLIHGDAGYDFIGGGADNDTIRGGDGADTIYGGLGDDNIGGGAGNDLIIESLGANAIWGGVGDDTIHGGSGNDTIDGGGDGTNTLYGKDGADFIRAGSGGDLISGGNGNDTIRGGGGADTLHGDAGSDNIGGGAGNDVIFGSAGSNTIWGGLGDDTLHGGTGRDVMSGGPGADVFVFASAAHIGIGTGRDVITGFASGEDRIDLSALNTQFNGTAGVLGGGQASFYYFAAGGLLIGDQTGNGAADWVLELTGAPALTAGDFLL